MEAALKRPPAWAERLVVIVTPPACRDAVVGDLCETYVSVPLYMREACRSVPFVIVSQMRRNANLPALGLQAFLVFICVGGFSSSRFGWTVLILPALAALVLLLRGAYQATGRPSTRRAIIEAILVAYGALVVSQVAILGMAVMRSSDLLIGLRFGFLVPLVPPLLCLFRTSLIIKSDRSRPFPVHDLSLEDVIGDYGLFVRRIRRRNRGEAGALGLAALFAVLYLRPGTPYALGGAYAQIGLVLTITYGLAAAYLLLEGGAQALPASADFLSLRAHYAHELARQQQQRRFLWWLWLTPVLIALHAKLIETGFAAGRPEPILLGSSAAVLLCFLISALNREHGGWVQEKIGLLDRVSENKSVAGS